MPLPSDKKLKEQWNKHRQISESAMDDQHEEARNDHAFFAGDRMAYTATVMDKSRRSMVVFNKVKPYVDSVVGFMIQLRRKPEYLARIMDSVAQQEFSTYLNALSGYARENANMDQIETTQDREMLITGYGAVDTNILYEESPDGEIKAENVEFDDIFWDPQAREPNLLDARWVYRRKKFSREEAEKRFPKVDPDDFEEYRENQTNFVYNPQGGLYDKIAFGIGTRIEDLVEIFYYQWWTLDTYYRARNPLFDIEDEFLLNQLSQVMSMMTEFRQEEAGKDEKEDYFDFDPFAEYLVMTPKIKRDMDAVFKRFGLDVEYQIHNKRVYYTALMTGETVIQKFRSLDQQGFTIKFKTGDYDHENERWFGMVAQLKEPARYMNKSLTEILYVIAANSKGGVMYEEGAVEDPARFEQQWATTKAAIKVNDGALQKASIQPKAQAALPNGYENVHEISNRAMGEVTGINKEFLGSSENKQVSALLESQRISQVTSALAGPFDSVTLHQKEHARYMITLLRVLGENSSGRLVKILGEDGAISYQELSNDRLAEEYDVDIGEAPTTAVQRAQTTEIMLQMADRLAVQGKNIYPVVVPYLPIKAADKQKLMEILEPPKPTPEQIRAQQEAQAIQREGALAEVAKTRNEASLKEAQTAKTIAEVENTEVDSDNTRANTLKTIEEGRQKAVENAVLESQPISNVEVVI